MFLHFHQPHIFAPKTRTCPVNKIMRKINEDIKDKSRLKLKEKDIFVGINGEKKKKKKVKN